MSRPYSRANSDDYVRSYIKARDNSIYLDDDIADVKVKRGFNDARIH